MTGISAKAADLKASIDDSLEQLAQAVDEQASSEEMKRYLNLMARFHRYSWGNCLLIAMAKPDATLVAGFSQWKRLGRMVRQGEKAIRIMAPCPVRREDPKTGDAEERVFFKSACVFDVSQTEGKELPDFEVPDIERNATNLLAALQDVATRRGIAVQFVNLPEGHYGSSKGGAIEIATGHSTGQQAKSLAHEIAHERLHWVQDGQIDQTVSREIRELEAEAVAYVVCRHFDLDVELRASRYIAHWGGDAKKLSSSLTRASKAARELIEDVKEQKVPATVESSVATPTAAAA
jgi:antirestriction protein ArdC